MLAVIPARGGSKGLPGKNIKELSGKELIVYTIEAALQAEIFDKVIVSTDSEQIAEIARKNGAEVPFIRPTEISGDYVSSDMVIQHALKYYEDKKKFFATVCKLQPTSPLRSCRHIKEAYELFVNRKADFVVSVCECEHSPLWTGQLGKNQSMDDFIKDEIKLSCRQKISTYYRLNGAIYIARVDAFERENSFFGKNGYAYIMEKSTSVDIDDIIDFKIAECLLGDGK